VDSVGRKTSVIVPAGPTVDISICWPLSATTASFPSIGPPLRAGQERRAVDGLGDLPEVHKGLTATGKQPLLLTAFVQATERLTLGTAALIPGLPPPGAVRPSPSPSPRWTCAPAGGWSSASSAVVTRDGAALRLVAEVPRPTRPGGPPVRLAGITPAVLARTARIYDGWLRYPPDPADYGRGPRSVPSPARTR
jgi:hypothetical protein